MDDNLLFALGSIVFILGGWGVVLVGLDWFQSWQHRESPEDAPHLTESGSAMDVVRARQPQDQAQRGTGD